MFLLCSSVALNASIISAQKTPVSPSHSSSVMTDASTIQTLDVAKHCLQHLSYQIQSKSFLNKYIQGGPCPPLTETFNLICFVFKLKWKLQALAWIEKCLSQVDNLKYHHSSCYFLSTSSEPCFRTGKLIEILCCSQGLELVFSLTVLGWNGVAIFPLIATFVFLFLLFCAWLEHASSESFNNQLVYSGQFQFLCISTTRQSVAFDLVLGSCSSDLRPW